MLQELCMKGGLIAMVLIRKMIWNLVKAVVLIIAGVIFFLVEAVILGVNYLIKRIRSKKEKRQENVRNIDKKVINW